MKKHEETMKPKDKNRNIDRNRDIIRERKREERGTVRNAPSSAESLFEKGP